MVGSCGRGGFFGWGGCGGCGGSVMGCGGVIFSVGFVLEWCSFNSVNVLVMFDMLIYLIILVL